MRPKYGVQAWDMLLFEMILSWATGLSDLDRGLEKIPYSRLIWRD